MAKCPVEDCKEVKELQDAVFGKHQDGLTYQIKDKIDRIKFKECMKIYIKKPPVWIRTVMVGFLLSVFLSSVATGYKVYFGQESAPLIYAEKDAVKDNKADIRLLKQSVESINKNLEARAVRVDSQFKEQNQKIEKGFDEIKDFMRVIMRRGKDKDK